MHVTTWLPLISAIVIASVTFAGIRINNRTNRAAITAADEREYAKWKRETVLRLCSEAVETALHAQGDFTRLAFELTSEAKAADLVEAINGYGRKLGANAAALHMLNVPKIGDACLELRTALTTRTFVWSADRLNSYKRELREGFAARPVDDFLIRDIKERIEIEEEVFKEGFRRAEQVRDELTRAAGAELHH